ncbi:universal stress protein [Aliarcobacter cryaerophilus]|uniref:universal stress protein n=1 Tax=Aliarcobacter cryaerophilus TaxID=28198 RepID=UPI003DA2247D
MYSHIFDTLLLYFEQMSIEALLQYQKENNLNIIAMGAYSHNRFRSAIFGSFTTKMLLNSQVPLLLFR